MDTYNMKADKVLSHQSRTDGDGMEFCQNETENLSDKRIKKSQKPRLVDILIFRPSDNSSSYLRPVIPTGRIVNLVPKYVPKETKKPRYLTKPKDPRFVPYEPYKAAIEPIIPRNQQLKKNFTQKESKNNVDIHDLVNQMSELASAELNKAKKEALQNDEPLITRKQWEEERHKFETDIKNLRESNTYLTNQIKFQAQVNSELKTLLVAAVGEDLESRVQHLTEDKLALARELLNSANHLTSHKEHTEWLSGQCEVWRSKFLASSLMVEELARWKSALTDKVRELKDIVKKLMDERTKIREISLNTYKNLSNISEHLTILNPETDINKSNIFEISKTNKTLSDSLIKYLIKDADKNFSNNESMFDDDVYTNVENSALLALRSPVVISDKPDVICNAVMGAALQVGRGQLFLQHPANHATCCSHCKGEVKNV